MVKIFITILLLIVNLQASVYEQNCVACHKKYSSSIETKYAIKLYLQNPKKENSILNEALLNRFGVKKKTTLNEKDLKKAIDEYWDKYKIFGKLK